MVKLSLSLLVSTQPKLVSMRTFVNLRDDVFVTLHRRVHGCGNIY
jgi:hypothetical protein